MHPFAGDPVFKIEIVIEIDFLLHLWFSASAFLALRESWIANHYVFFDFD